MPIRPLQESDYPSLYDLYRRQTADLPYHHNVRLDQFRDHLLTTRYLRSPDDHHARAKIALVATSGRRVVAMVSGGIVTQGDEVVESGTGYIQSILAEAGQVGAVKELLNHVVKHLRRFRPLKIVAQDACLSPVFFADSASTLSSGHAWIGQALLDSGFIIRDRALRMVAPLDHRRPITPPPKDLTFLHIGHEMFGFNPKYDFGCLLLKPPYGQGDGVVWCGCFYSGVFVKGTAYRSLFINWFTIIDESFRGKGFGRLVLQHCLQQAQQQGSQFASLLTLDDNFVAHNLYLSEGFKVVDVTHSFTLPANRSAALPHRRRS